MEIPSIRGLKYGLTMSFEVILILANNTRIKIVRTKDDALNHHQLKESEVCDMAMLTSEDFRSIVLVTCFWAEVFTHPPVRQQAKRVTTQARGRQTVSYISIFAIISPIIAFLNQSSNFRWHFLQWMDFGRKMLVCKIMLTNPITTVLHTGLAYPFWTLKESQNWLFDTLLVVHWKLIGLDRWF